MCAYNQRCCIHDNCLRESNNDDETLGNFCKGILQKTNRTALQAEWRVDRWVPENEKKSNLLMRRHTPAHTRPCTHCTSFCIIFWLTSMWPFRLTLTLVRVKVVQCFRIFQHFCDWHSSCAPLAIKYNKGVVTFTRLIGITGLTSSWTSPASILAIVIIMFRWALS